MVFRWAHRWFFSLWLTPDRGLTEIKHLTHGRDHTIGDNIRLYISFCLLFIYSDCDNNKMWFNFCFTRSQWQFRPSRRIEPITTKEAITNEREELLSYFALFCFCPLLACDFCLVFSLLLVSIRFVCKGRLWRDCFNEIKSNRLGSESASKRIQSNRIESN